MTDPSAEGRFRRLFPAGCYALVQTFFLFALLQALLERGVESWLYIVPDVVMFLYIFVPASLPALAVGIVDGFARTPRRTAWGVLLKVVAWLLVVALGLFITLIGAFFLAFIESNLNADIFPLPLGMYLGALLGMEAALALSWGTALSTDRFLEDRRSGAENP
jgi:hypothetical protein